MAHPVAMALLALSLNSTPPEPPSHEAADLKVIRQNTSQVQGCYERARAKSSRTQGEVIVEWDITTWGGVDKARVTSNTTGDKELADCLLQAVKTWQFEARESDAPTHMSHPFRLLVAQ
ncbi:AgmX/PglI C-terminal domain-containing protein [Hyalangium versicolor]|uniref:AgmX/PglI C-terminal domain-containing protein n=1 Tax=Hyalangium versicolor TaxID=2861190 RepID=UPI001CC95C0C|nr:AgmX/PglI C-terminal domain-containing protein [Hyalangium versicolor]